MQIESIMYMEHLKWVSSSHSHNTSAEEAETEYSSMVKLKRSE